MKALKAWYALFAAAVVACSPQKTGQKFYLYISQRDRNMYRDAVVEASKEARKHGTELVFETLDGFLAKSVEVALSPLVAGDALALMVYAEDWGPLLQGRLKAMQAQLGERQVRLGLWLLGRGTAPPLPASLPVQNNFDAVSSPSAERPGKAMAKKFFRPWCNAAKIKAPKLGPALQATQKLFDPGCDLAALATTLTTREAP